MNISSSCSGMSRPDPAEMRAQLFKDTDADGNGSITKEELTNAIANRPQPPQGGPQGAGDGKAPDVDELFKKLDADGNGEITEAEHDAGLEAMHAEHEKKAGSMNFSGSSDKLQTLLESFLKETQESGESDTTTTKGDLIKELIARLTQETQTKSYSSDGSEDTSSGTNLFSATV